jgi:quercetin 2,3-dioxygenase
VTVHAPAHTTAGRSGPVLQVVRLGAPPWPTVDPFLFCVHHVDAYPAGNGRSGPATSLAGRPIGSDFAGIDGWRMYHGQQVPGFPQHPHRGFETVTIVRRGLVDHADSLGAAARYGHGDVQWLTAGAGIVHCEMFPLLDESAPNPLELFQIWVNLPAADKMADPHFTMFWADRIPRLVRDGLDVQVVAGSIAESGDRLVALDPPPHSWASHPGADVAIWTVRLDPGASWSMPAAAGADSVRVVYVIGDGEASFDGAVVAPGYAAVLDATSPVLLTSSTAQVELLVLQGRPIGEPVAQYGPFVMNDEAGVREAFADYRRTGFGGWPWPSDEPVHADAGGRFARHPDGRVERPGGDPA